MEWSCEQNSSGRACRQLCLPCRCAASRQRFPRSGTCRTGKRCICETGATKQQRDCRQTGTCFSEGTKRTSRQARACSNGPTCPEAASELGQRAADSERRQEAIVYGRDRG